MLSRVATIDALKLVESTCCEGLLAASGSARLPCSIAKKRKRKSFETCGCNGHHVGLEERHTDAAGREGVLGQRFLIRELEPHRG